MICKNKKCAIELPDGAKYCYACGRKQIAEKRSRKRGNGQGSVYQLPNGKWRAVKTLGYELVPDSDPPRARRIYATRSDFDKAVDAANFLPLLGTPLDTRKTKYAPAPEKEKDRTHITLKELYDLWFPTHQKSRSTMNCFAAGFKIFEECWSLPMSEQDIDDLQECIDTCGKGRRTQENARAALGLVYKYGIPRGYVPGNIAGEPNLAKFLRLGDSEKTHKPGLSAEELAKLQAALGKVPYADYVYCHCYLGFRPSAFIALKAADYNAAERAIMGGIKTDAGIDRTVTISPKIQPIIDRLLSDTRSEYIFCHKDTGEALSIKKYREIFYEVLDAAGIQPLSEPPHRLTPHSCRHTFATLIKRVDAPEKDKLELIGHTSEEMLRYYQDVDFDDLRKITDCM